MISLSGAAMIIVYLLIAAAVFGLLWWLIDVVSGLFPGEPSQMFVKVARVVLIILVILVLLGFLMSLISPQPVFRA